ncbi:retrovirus-related Pol polyprotein from transposon 412 [Trichonephila clavipes]|nr:retrovirus-related Pol polyprotein from transposon 412 [Trichonephila clavipes]
MTWQFATEKDQHMEMQTPFREDPVLRAVNTARESKRKLAWQGLAPFHPTTKRYWALWTVHLRSGVLYRKWESDDGKTFRWQFILPKTKVSTVLKELHSSPTGGHFGVMKTLQKVCECFYWNNVRSDVEKCCRICDPCAERKDPRKCTRRRRQLYNVGAPFQRIAFDILGQSDGNDNILVVMDYFTKWPEAYPISDQEASTVAEVLVQHWISRFGIPLQLHSDQGKNFDSAVCKRLCVKYSQSSKPEQQLYILSLTAWSAVHETTGYSPSQMVLGHDLRRPADLLFSWPPVAPLTSEEYIKKLQARMEEVHHLTRHDFQEDDQIRRKSNRTRLP